MIQTIKRTLRRQSIRTFSSSNSEDNVALRDMVRRFAQERVAPLAH